MGFIIWSSPELESIKISITTPLLTKKNCQIWSSSPAYNSNNVYQIEAKEL